MLAVVAPFTGAWIEIRYLLKLKELNIVSPFPNEQSCLRCIATLCMEYSEEWTTGRRYLKMEDVEETQSKKNIKTETILQKIEDLTGI